jgi:hypothetical protein
MPILVMLMFATSPGFVPRCSVDQLHVLLDRRGGDFNVMSHSGTELSIRNTGPHCLLVACLPFNCVTLAIA